ncbi:MAG: GntR family transcriptional regulator [Enterococcus faecalis]|uniref:GntR family transcriptional regulator n=1 Tax=Enterococcus faecalis TaxID=1351 RepID=UPI0003D5DBD5|nr:GntR family transcriptional regulator [Enterococcus faecalis]ETJ08867.1 MAG: GntR family transcriptional regulator [Enterococcus faecalis DORA_14]MDK6785455.1 GntR family transcriptional regulator [Enterococcus faecalis]MDK7808672.1 GntR family transcriptional regulator [Enterococcus faecalis]MDU0911057.1 GntR family transcriptional regulator [Enterococcus faecalis]MDU0934530.1 GntR family transcriptional regulator [Enterococcus faecalis]
MEFIFSGEKPLFQQVADQIAEGIFNGAYLEGEQIPSTTEISKSYQINPATVLKGMNLLVERQLIEKKRGIGMFVLPGAQERVRSARKEEFLNKEVLEVVAEAKKLGITAEQLKQLIERGYDA